MSGFNVIGPNPKCEQGIGYQLNANSTGSKLVYGSGKNLVVRDYENPQICNIYTGHSAQVKVARFNHNGDTIASGDKSGKIHLLKLQPSGEIVQEKQMVGIAGEIYDLAWDFPDKRIAVVGDSRGNRGRVFMTSGTEQGEIAQSTKRLMTVDIRNQCDQSGSTLATGSEDFSIRHFVYKGGYTLNILPHDPKHENTCQMIRYSPDGKYLISVGGKTIKMFDALTCAPVREFNQDHKGTIYAVSWAPESNRFITSSADKTVKLWDVESGKVLTTFNLKGKSNYKRDVMDMQVGCTYAGNRIVSLSLCGDINYLDESRGDTARIIQATTGSNFGLEVLNNKTLASISTEGETFLYDSEGLAHRISGNTDEKVGVGLVSVSGKLYTTAYDDKVREADPGTAKFTGVEFPLEHQPNSISKSEKGVFIVTTSAEVYVMKDAKNPVASLKFPKGLEGKCGAISPEGDEVAVGMTDKSIRFYSLAGGKLTDTGKVYDGLYELPECIVYSKNHIAIGTKNKYIKCYVRRTGEDISGISWCFHNGKIPALAFSPNGTYLASGALDQNIILWDTTKDKNHKVRQFTAAHPQGVQCIVWSDDKTFYSSGTIDGSIKVWNL